MKCLVESQSKMELIRNRCTRFIFKNYYYRNLPNSLLVAQAFILKYPDHGKKYGLSTINKIIEDEIERTFKPFTE